jgi:ribosomal protein S6
MSRALIYDKPMTKAQADKRYEEKMKCWKNRNYSTFCFHLPKKLVSEFRRITKINGDVQRQLVINMMVDYIKEHRE